MIKHSKIHSQVNISDRRAQNHIRQQSSIYHVWLIVLSYHIISSDSHNFQVGYLLLIVCFICRKDHHTCVNGIAHRLARYALLALLAGSNCNWFDEPPNLISDSLFEGCRCCLPCVLYSSFDGGRAKPKRLQMNILSFLPLWGPHGLILFDKDHI